MTTLQPQSSTQERRRLGAEQDPRPSVVESSVQTVAAHMKPLHQFNAAEADRWIIEMRRSLSAHADRLQGTQYPGEVRAAMDTHLMLLREMASVHPDKREKIEALVALYERT